ncbi:MAG: lysophospholipid acyltransferase family protein [Betaproteobacteria bacterium]
MAHLTLKGRLLLILRCLRLGLHLLWGAITVATVYPLIRDTRRLWLKQRWSRQLLEIIGVRIDAQLSGVTPGSLFVSNHISWLDIYALNAARPMAFVSKAEVRSWPLIGWLSANTDTLFLSRDSRRQTKRVNAEMSEMLLAEKDVAIFPEGTTTEGTQLLHFHGALLQSAIDTGRPVQPVALSYYDASGRRSLVPAYIGETSLGESLLAIITCGSLTVRLRPTPPLDSQSMTRRELANAARGAIAFNLGLPGADDVAEPAHKPSREYQNPDQGSDGLDVERSKQAIAG